MRIAVIGSRGIDSTYGGIERVLGELCPRIAARGHRVVVFSATVRGGPKELDGVRIVRVPALAGKYTDTISRSLLAAVASYGRSFDVVHLVGLGSAALTRACRGFGRSVVVGVHGLDWARDKWPPFARKMLLAAEREAVRAADGITVVSHALSAHYRHTYGRETTVIPNAIMASPTPDLSRLAALGLERERFLLFAGRLVPEKGVHDLIEAYARLRPDVPLVIAGAASHEPDYERRLREAAAGHDVRFTGHVTGPTLQALMGGAYAFVLPSYLEGCSLALLEALGHRRAAIVSDIAENVEAAGDLAFTFKTGDVDDLTRAIDRLLHHPDLVRARQQKILHRLGNLWSWDRCAAAYEEAFDRAMYRRLASDRAPNPNRVLP